MLASVTLFPGKWKSDSFPRFKKYFGRMAKGIFKKELDPKCSEDIIKNVVS